MYNNVNHLTKQNPSLEKERRHKVPIISEELPTFDCFWDRETCLLLVCFFQYYQSWCGPHSGQAPSPGVVSQYKLNCTEAGENLWIQRRDRIWKELGERKISSKYIILNLLRVNKTFKMSYTCCVISYSATYLPQRNKAHVHQVLAVLL